MVRAQLQNAPRIELMSLTTNRWPGCSRGLHLHPRRESCPLQTVSRDAQIPHRGSPCVVPQAGRQRHSAHNRRAGQCPIRLPASRRALHGAHHQPTVQHSARHRLPAPVRPGRLQHLQDARRERDCPKCLRASQRIRRTGHTGLPREPDHQPDQDLFGNGES